MSAVPSDSPRLSAEAFRRIDRELRKYPPDQKQSAVMAALAIAQDEIGWLPKDVIGEVAAYLGMPAIAAYEVATFYAMYNLQPVGRTKITLCTNLPCALSGATHAAEHLRKRLGVDFGETTADGRFTLVEAECLGSCGTAPMMQVGNEYYENLDEARVDKILADLK